MSFSDPPSTLRLNPEEIHVWRVSLDLPEGEVARLFALLSEEERKRAERFYFPEHRRQFTVARGSLRVLLGRYLDRAPEEISFVYGERGKPSLSPALGEQTLCFNVSHSGEIALHAFVHSRRIGVDVEKMRPLKDAMQIAEHYFSLREKSQLRGVSEEERQLAFFNGWTRKEAFIKATGEGLSRALDSFDVSLVPGAPVLLFRVDNDPEEAGRWWLENIPIDPGYRAALVVEGPKLPVSCWRFPTNSG